MHTGHASRKWQRASGRLISFLLVGGAATIAVLPGGAAAHALESASRHPQVRPASHPASTPVPDAPTITATPDQGPVKTLVTLQGAGWPSGSQVLIFYDNDPTCAGPNHTELSPDPAPTANSAGEFSVKFSWPAVDATGTWYICAATSDGATTGKASFGVLSLTPPSLTILTKGPFLPGQTITVQGENWLPGGLYIAFSLQRAGTKTSYPLEESPISLQNGTFSATSITIPSYLPPGSYILVATMEQQALRAQSGTITIAATPTPTPTATPTPSPTPLPITATPTPIINHHPQPPAAPHRLSGTLLALVIISGGMALSFALIGTALLIYLRRSRPIPSAPLALEPYDDTRQLKPDPSE